MPPMALQNEELSDDNVHVKELQRLFNSCTNGQNGLLDKDGLILLCEKLNLSDFSDSILDRVLCDDSLISFKQFKDRFLLFLPEIIDLASGNTDEVLIAAYKTCSTLGIKETHRLSRYDVHAICEATTELDLLSVNDVNVIFDKSSAGGVVPLVDFINQFRAKQKLSNENLLADAYLISSINLFEAIDVHNNGQADKSSVIDYLTTSGLKLEEAIGLIKDVGQSASAVIGLMSLGNYLETALSHLLISSPVAARAGVFCMKSLIENYRCSIRDFEMRCEHLQKQIHIANQRRTMLIEELDQNQQSIEASYNNRLQEMEERFRHRIAVMEEKFRQERVELQREIETIEKDLSVVRHNETSLKNKLQLVERHNKRISAELEDQTENANSLEKENQQLRQEIRMKQQFRKSEDTSMLKDKIEHFAVKNKRLREKLDKYTKRLMNDNDSAEKESYVQWTPSFKTQLILIRKRRTQKLDTLSELESEPEPIFYRRRRKRLHKRKDRMKRYENVHNLACTNGFSDDALSNLDDSSKKKIVSSRNMLINLKESEMSNDRKLIERAKNSMRSKDAILDFDELSHVKHYSSEIKMLKTSLIAQKNMYESQISNLSRKLATIQSEQQMDKHNSKTYSMFDKYRTQEPNAVASLGMEKCLTPQRYQKPSLSAPCTKCTTIENKMKELSVLVGAHNIGKDFTVEDPTPSMSAQEKVIKSENSRLKTRLNLVRNKVTEIHLILSLPCENMSLLENPVRVPYSARTHRSFADLHERTPLSERGETKKHSVADPSQFRHLLPKELT